MPTLQAEAPGRLLGRHLAELEVLLSAARDGKAVSVSDLVAATGASAATVYSDLEVLARVSLQRNRGSVSLCLGEPAGFQPERFGTQLSVKRAMARFVVRDLLPVGAVVYVDTGSSAHFVAEEIAAVPRSDLRLVTSNPKTIELMDQTAAAIEVIVTGGILRREAASLYGNLVVATLNRVPFDTAVVSLDFVHADNELTLATFSGAETDQKRAALSNAQERIIFLADESKIGRPLGQSFGALLEVSRTHDVRLVIGCEAKSAPVREFAAHATHVLGSESVHLVGPEDL